MSTPFRVLIADAMSSRAAEIMAASSSIEVDDRAGISAEELTSAVSEYQGVVVRSRTKVNAEVIAAAAKLKLIGRAGIGVDNIDLAAASGAGVVVENAPTGNSVTTAEHALCLMMSLARHIPQATASMKAGKWDKKKYSGVELCDKTLGLVGLGNIGGIVADRAAGLKMKVIASDPFADSEKAQKLGVELVEFDELLRRSDFISIHTPATPQTRGMFNAEAFAKCKPGVRLVNAARGGIVDEAALVAALDEGVVAGAAFDVFETEPPPAGHALVAHANVICTPHLGASTGDAQVKVAEEIARQFVAYAEDGTVINQVNK